MERKVDIIFGKVYHKFKLNLYKNMFRRLSQNQEGLTATEAFTVEVIYALGKPTIGDLVDFLELSQPNLTYKVAQLVRKGYVKKVTSESDKRKVFLEVTDKFKDYYSIKNEYVEHAMNKLSESMSPEQLANFEKLLEALNESLVDTPHE